MRCHGDEKAKMVSWYLQGLGADFPGCYLWLWQQHQQTTSQVHFFCSGEVAASGNDISPFRIWSSPAFPRTSLLWCTWYFASGWSLHLLLSLFICIWWVAVFLGCHHCETRRERSSQGRLWDRPGHSSPSPVDNGRQDQCSVASHPDAWQPNLPCQSMLWIGLILSPRMRSRTRQGFPCLDIIC